MMASIGFQSPQNGTGLGQNLKTSKPKHTSLVKVSCGLRNGARKPMWRSRVLSTEAIQAVQSLKLAKSAAHQQLHHVFNTRLSRLLKADLLDTLNELRRQNELHLALMVFNYVRKEVWYQPDLALFNDMILMFGKNKMIDMAERLFSEIVEEGLNPDTRTYTEMIGAYFRVNMIDKAMARYELMKASGFVPDKLVLTILIRNLEKAGEEELVAKVKKDCHEYLDSPQKFLEEVGRTYPKRKSIELV